MADVEHDTGFLSIGEVLNLLVEEFPDVTISKIRFLESQGLISPERTASGYRKFYSDDIELLRVILTEQRENFLPLRVIRNRLETGEIDPTGEHLRPDPDLILDDIPIENIRDIEDIESIATPSTAAPSTASSNAALPTTQIPSTPRTKSSQARLDSPPSTEFGATPSERQTAATSIVSNTRVGRDEFLRLAELTDDELDELESFGVVVSHSSGGASVYDNAALQIALPAGKFLRAGVDSRHLRLWRTAAEREASLYEQIVAPRFRQRNPEATADAIEQLKRLDALGMRLRNALMQQLLARHLDG